MLSQILGWSAIFSGAKDMMPKGKEAEIVYDILSHFYPNSMSYGGHDIRRTMDELPVIKKYLSGIVKTSTVKSSDGRDLLVKAKKRQKWPNDLVLQLLINERNALSDQLDEVYTHVKVLEQIL